jgi:putative component of membrane protein insertase Oxa1/YidC/SpoIIIJ protein YidD
MKQLIFLILLLCFASVYAQTDWAKWDKSNVSYLRSSEHKKRSYSFSGNNLPETSIKIFTSAYWFFISYVDGDNCPFQPSCSSFLIDAVKETNLIQGTLMFFDRFTRDLNVFNRANKYPRVGISHFYDPVQLYTLSENKIHFSPPGIFIKSE